MAYLRIGLYLKAIIKTIPILFLTSCLYFTETITSAPIYSSPEHITLKYYSIINKECENIKKKYNHLMLIDSNKLQIKMNRLLKDVENHYNAIDRYNTHVSNLLILYGIKNDVKIIIYATDLPEAISFPNNEIHFSRGLLDGGFQYSAKNDTQLYCLIVHEYMHLANLHIPYIFAARETKNEIFEEDLKNTITNSLTILSPIKIKKYHKSSEPVPNLEVCYQLIEYLCDFKTYWFIKSMNLDPKEYIKLLNSKLEYAKNKKEKDFIKKRIDCLERIERIKKEKLSSQHIVVVSQKDIDKFYTLLNINNSYYNIPLDRYIVYWDAALYYIGHPVYLQNYTIYNGVVRPLYVYHNGEIFTAFTIPERIFNFQLF